MSDKWDEETKPPLNRKGSVNFSLCSEDKDRRRGRIAQHLQKWMFEKSRVSIEPGVMIHFLLLFLLLCILVGDGLVKPEALNKKAIQIINRVRDKLTGECVCVYLNLKSERLFSPWVGGQPHIPVPLAPQFWLCC